MPERIAGDRWISLWRSDGGDVFVQMQDAALVVPITDAGEVLLVREPSPAYGGSELVLPGGVIEEGESPEAAANRELREEIGLRGDLRHLGQVTPMVKYVRARFDVFVGTNLVPDELVGDEEHDVIVVPTPSSEIAALIAAGRLSDASAVAALALAGVPLPPPRP